MVALSSLPLPPSMTSTSVGMQTASSIGSANKTYAGKNSSSSAATTGAIVTANGGARSGSDGLHALEV